MKHIMDPCHPRTPLVDAMRAHANELNGDGCWRDLLREGAGELERLRTTAADVAVVLDRLAQALADGGEIWNDDDEALLRSLAARLRQREDRP